MFNKLCDLNPVDALSVVAGYFDVSSLMAEPVKEVRLLPVFFRAVLKNFRRATKGHRHSSEVLNAFAYILYFRAGRYAYELVRENLPSVLPAITTLMRERPATVTPLVSVGFCKNVLAWAQKHAAPTPYLLAGDATAVLKLLHWESQSNKIIGFVVPDDENPDLTFREYASLSALSARYPIASSVYVFMLVPLVPSSHAPVVAAIFPSVNTEKADTLIQRWKKLYELAGEIGIALVGVAGDGDPKQLSAMQIIVGESYPTQITILSGQVFIAFQDHNHLGVKLRGSMISPVRNLRIGTYDVKIDHIKALVDSGLSEHELGIRPSEDLDPKDRQNFSSVERLWCERIVIALKRHDASYYGTAVYLEASRKFVHAFLDDLTPTRRVFDAWSSYYFFMGWRNWLLANKVSGVQYGLLSVHFITSNQWACLQLNAKSLLAIISHFRDKYPDIPLHTHLFSSQSCEILFSELRAGYAGVSHNDEFDVLESVYRINRASRAHALVSTHQNDIVFPVHRKHKHRHAIHVDSATMTCRGVTSEVLLATVAEARTSAKRVLRSLGISKPGLTRTTHLPVSEVDLAEIDNNEDVIVDVPISSPIDLAEEWEEEVMEEGFIPQNDTAYVQYMGVDGQPISVHKQTACATFAGHPTGIQARLFRVRTM